MGRPSTSQITLSGFHLTGLPPRAVRDDDARLLPRGAAEAVLGSYVRGNVQLLPASGAAPQWLQNGTPATLAATTLPEYVVPDLVVSHPGPVIVINVARVLYLPFTAALDPITSLDIDPVDTVPPGDFWVYRAVLADGSIEQRIRIGTPPVPGPTDDVRALLYCIDWTA